MKSLGAAGHPRLGALGVLGGEKNGGCGGLPPARLIVSLW